MNTLNSLSNKSGAKHSRHLAQCTRSMLELKQESIATVFSCPYASFLTPQQHIQWGTGPSLRLLLVFLRGLLD